MTDLHLGGKDFNLGKFQVFRMVPRKPVMYFFSYKGQAFVSPNQSTVSIDESICLQANKKLKTNYKDANKFVSPMRKSKDQRGSSMSLRDSLLSMKDEPVFDENNP